MRLFNFQIPDDLYDQLVMAAATSDRSASLFVREAIREKLARETPAEVIPFRKAGPTPLAEESEQDRLLAANPAREHNFHRGRNRRRVT